MTEAMAIKQSPTLYTRMPAFTPYSFTYTVGVRTKCPPSQLNIMQTHVAYKKFLKLESCICIIRGKQKPIIP